MLLQRRELKYMVKYKFHYMQGSTLTFFATTTCVPKVKYLGAQTYLFFQFIEHFIHKEAAQTK